MGEKINPWRKCHTEHYWSYYFVGYDKAVELKDLTSEEPTPKA